MGSGVCYGDVNEWKLCDIYRSVWEVGYVYGSVVCVSACWDQKREQNP